MNKTLGIVMSVSFMSVCFPCQSSTIKPQKVLVISPHPDDDIIGCGGSIAKHIKNGNSVSIVYMTSGEAYDRTRDKKELAAMREQEARNAATVLGVKTLYFLRKPDANLTYDQKTIADLVSIIRKEQPQIIYAPHANDGHKDHKTTYLIVEDAIKYAHKTARQTSTRKPWHLKLFLCYEVWTPLQHCSYREDISDFITLKLKALRNHKSQIAGCRYDDAVKGLNRYRGEMGRTGTYCECFTTVDIAIEQRLFKQ